MSCRYPHCSKPDDIRLKSANKKKWFFIDFRKLRTFPGLVNPVFWRVIRKERSKEYRGRILKGGWILCRRNVMCAASSFLQESIPVLAGYIVIISGKEIASLEAAP
jgi:hypothetical protein